MASPADIVDKIALQLSSITPEQFRAEAGPAQMHVVIAKRLSFQDLSHELASILGEEHVASFFENSRSGLLDILCNTIFACSSVGAGPCVLLNKERLTEFLSQLAVCIRAGAVDYSISFHIVNIDVADEVTLDEGVILRRVPRDEVEWKYPLFSEYTSAPPAFIAGNWLNHTVEAVFIRRGKPRDIKRDFSVEAADALEHSITHAILLSGVAGDNNTAYATHAVLDSLVERTCVNKGVRGFAFVPKRLGPEEIDRLRSAYALLKNTANDRVLQTAVDRFILGRKQGNHHRNKVNQPNWDKVVDYVIAMETLFLTISGNAAEQELAYRFRLNGSSLLSQVCGTDRRHAFEALKALYEIRSKVVHGCDDSAILKPANRFIDLLAIDIPDHQHDLGRLMLVSRQVEAWLTKLLFSLAQMSSAERPYRKDGAWEEMLWASGRQSTGGNAESVR